MPRMIDVLVIFVLFEFMVKRGQDSHVSQTRDADKALTNGYK